MNGLSCPLAACLRSIERAALDGRRCPVNGTEDVDQLRVEVLALRGHIRSEISGQNWRTVHILTGPHAGRSTLPHPKRLLPWKVTDTGGTHRVKDFVSQNTLLQRQREARNERAA